MSSTNPPQHEWEIGLDSWIIQDGNYGDFSKGQTAEFALEFYPDDKVRFNESKEKSVKPLGAARYEINGEIVYLNNKVWVIDFGICAFQEATPPSDIKVGQYVTAEIYLGIDPFFYFESLHSYPGMPPLVYAWRINSIGMQTAPFIEKRHSFFAQKVLIRDPTKIGYRAIEKTDAWKDDNGNAGYVLTCIRLDVPPKYESVTAT